VVKKFPEDRLVDVVLEAVDEFEEHAKIERATLSKTDKNS
jgi:hypothetical protein